jgi:hypothetical protein
MMSDHFFEADSFPDRRCWRAWRAHLAELGALELAELASETLLAARRRRWLGEWRARLGAAVRRLERDGEDSSLAEVLWEIYEFAEIEG